MKSLNIFKIVVISLMVWGCSNGSSSPAAPAAEKGTPQGQKPVPSLTSAAFNHASAQSEARELCQLGIFFIDDGETCKVAPYPNPLLEQIAFIEQTMIPAIDTLMAYQKKQDTKSQLAELQIEKLQTERQFFTKTLSHLKLTQESIKAELATRSKELTQANSELNVALTDLTAMGCDVKGLVFSCPEPQTITLAEVDEFLLKQKKIRKTQESLAKINSIYKTMKNNYIEDFLIAQDLLKKAETQSDAWARKIESAFYNRIDELSASIEKIKDDFSFKLNVLPFTYEEILAMRNKTAQESISPSNLNFLKERVQLLERASQFFTDHQNLLTSKAFDSLVLQIDLAFSKYKPEHYDYFPSQNGLAVKMTLNTTEQEWLRQIQALDDIKGNPLLEKRTKDIEQINALISKIKTAEAHKDFPVFVELPLEWFEDQVQLVSETLEAYQTVEEFIFKEFPISMNKKIYPFLTGLEQTQIVLYAPFDKRPPSNRDLLIIGLEYGYVQLGDKEPLKFEMQRALLTWLATWGQ